MPKDTFLNLPEEKRQMLVQLSMKEFAEKPYEQASVTSIVHQAGIAKGSVYQYFENKRDLYFYLIDLAVQSKLDWAREHAATPTGDFFVDLREQMIMGAVWNVEHVVETKLLSGVASSPFKQEGTERLQGQADVFMTQLVEHAQASGKIRSDIPAPQVAAYMLAVLNGLSNYVASVIGADDSELFADQHRAKLQRVELRSLITDLVKMLQHGLSSTT